MEREELKVENLSDAIDFLYHGAFVRPQVQRRIVAEHDVDHDGYFHYDDFTSVVREIRPHLTFSATLTLKNLNELSDIFAKVDTDFSGTITADELEHILGACGMTTSKVLPLLKKFDLDGDLCLTFNEFVLLAEVFE